MRHHSVYEFTCLCGAPIQTPAPHATCTVCGRHIRLDWQPKDANQMSIDWKPEEPKH
jgi:hypothetical protein